MKIAMRFAALLVTLFANAALAQSGAEDPPRALYTTASGVSLQDLGYTYSNVDISVGPFSLERSYASQRFTSSEAFGRGWSHNYDIWIRSSILRNQWHTDVFIGRSIHKFLGPATQNFPDNDEVGTSVQIVGGVPTFKDRDGTTYRFFPLTSSVAKISSITKASGEILNFNYSGNLLKNIDSNRGFSLVFEYFGSRISSACTINRSEFHVSSSTSCATANLKTSYFYNGEYLTSFVDVMKTTSSLQYDYSTGTGYLTCITQPGSSVCPVVNTYTNHYNFRTVTKQSMADGSVWQYTCTCGDEGRADPDNFYPIETTGITDPTGAVSGISFKAGAPYQTSDGNGNIRTWEFFGRFPVKVTDPEGNYNVIGYNPRMVPSVSLYRSRPGTNLPDVVTSKIFPTDCTNPVTCNQPVVSTDANGNVTDYAYDQTHGGIIWEMRPAPVAGGARPLKISSYSQKSAYVRSSGGGLVSTGLPIWLLESERLCQTTAGSSSPVCDTAAPVTTTTYQYGPDGAANSLLLRGKLVSADGQSLRTCYGYDSFANKISETQPRAGLTTCQ